ncbi:MAG: DUF2225 domain-containing protein [Lachnospiraceae bacterium]|nr:DUF2225 domain-containing protein [Lachnospiraceae bacterium]
MSGLLSGLSKFGLKNLEKKELFQEEEKKKETPPKDTKPAMQVMKEEDYLFDKTYECPVCYQKIKERTMRVGKAKLLKTDMDLRPVYENIEPLKYDVIVCQCCGYSVLSRYFMGLTPSQIKAVKDSISMSFKPYEEKKETYTYEEALERYKLCLASTIVKHGKASEKAYICLKAGWLLRSMREALDEELEGYDEKDAELKVEEDEFLQNALEGFLNARQSESYPMCGMDEATVEFLIAMLAMEYEQFDVASKILPAIITSVTANNRMKDKAREAKEILLEKMKEKEKNAN